MRRDEQNTGSKFTSMIIFLYIIFSAVLLFAQPNSKNQTEENKINNLITALHSDNKGLIKSAIYFTGKYKFERLIPELCALYKKEDNENTKYLIIMALYNIKTEESIRLATNLCINDKANRFNFIGKEIAKTYSDTNSLLTKE